MLLYLVILVGILGYVVFTVLSSIFYTKITSSPVSDADLHWIIALSLAWPITLPITLVVSMIIALGDLHMKLLRKVAHNPRKQVDN